jgi:hypothetical protein
MLKIQACPLHVLLLLDNDIVFWWSDMPVLPLSDKYMALAFICGLDGGIMQIKNCDWWICKTISCTEKEV